jgi:type VI secretion system (T6SS) effector TldE1-like protein
MWTYVVITGTLNHLEVQVGRGYSGHGEGINNPTLGWESNVGPIPAGQWTVGEAVDHPRLGPVAMPLTPNIGTAMLGRGGFWIHGDSVEFADLEEASHGCIIFARSIRESISSDPDRDLTVI